MTVGTWIEFVEIAPPRPQKTKVWEVRSRQGGDVLGRVGWFGRWRRYAFWPVPQTIYDEVCMRDISDFLEEETRMRREQRKRERWGPDHVG